MEVQVRGREADGLFSNNHTAAGLMGGQYQHFGNLHVCRGVGCKDGNVGDVYAANAPAHVQIAEVLILATHQASGSVIVRK